MQKANASKSQNAENPSENPSPKKFDFTQIAKSIRPDSDEEKIAETKDETMAPLVNPMIPHGLPSPMMPLQFRPDLSMLRFPQPRAFPVQTPYMRPPW